MTFGNDNEVITAEARKLCATKCFRMDCLTQEIRFTYITPLLHSLPSDNNYIIFLEPMKGPLKVIYKPLISLIDFITYELCCVSFWLGWAPLPFLLGLDLSWLKMMITRRNLSNTTTNQVVPKSQQELSVLNMQIRVKRVEKKLQSHIVILNEKIAGIDDLHCTCHCKAYSAGK